MARSEVNPSARKRILRTARDRLLYEVETVAKEGRESLESATAEESGHPAADAAAREGKKVSAPRRPRRRKGAKRGRLVSLAVAKLILLALFIVAGVAAIIWLRNLGEAFGINWVGD